MQLLMIKLLHCGFNRFYKILFCEFPVSRGQIYYIVFHIIILWFLLMLGCIWSEILVVFKLLDIVHDLVCLFGHVFDLLHNFLNAELSLEGLKWWVNLPGQDKFKLKIMSWPFICLWFAFDDNILVFFSFLYTDVAFFSIFCVVNPIIIIDILHDSC